MNYLTQLSTTNSKTNGVYLNIYINNKPHILGETLSTNRSNCYGRHVLYTVWWVRFCIFFDLFLRAGSIFVIVIVSVGKWMSHYIYQELLCVIHKITDKYFFFIVEIKLKFLDLKYFFVWFIGLFFAKRTVINNLPIILIDCKRRNSVH